MAVDSGLGVDPGLKKGGTTLGPLTDSQELAPTPGGSAAFRIQAAGACP